MELENPCCCCLLRPPDKDLNTPYVFLGVTETFSDLLEECFQIYFITGLDNTTGICEECVGRLREAREFKLQVQRSQAELQARLERALRVKDMEYNNAFFAIDEDPPVKLELSDDSDEDYMIQAAAKWEISDDAISERESTPCPAEPPPAAAPSEPGLVSPRARQQLAMACSVRLERLRDDKAPHARHTRPRTSPHHKRLTTHMRVRAERDPDGTEPRDLASGRRAATNTYTCDQCGEQFARKSDIVTHLKNHEGDNKACSKQLREKCALVQQQRTHVNSDFFKKIPLKSNIMAHNIIHSSDKPYACDTCNKQFTSKSALNRHMRIHTGQKPYSCDVCSKKFGRSGTLTQHKLTHSSNKPYACDTCNKQFTYKSNLTTHIRTHTGERPYFCEVCSKKFSDRGHLRAHKRTHTGDKPYTCGICNKQFTFNSDLTRHMRIHTGQKPYSCDVCSKKFGRSGTLTEHKLTHSSHKPYTCDTCNKQFTKKSNLTTHIRSHTGERPYSCDICSKKFSNQGNFRSHKRTHTGDKPYTCEICNKQFKRKSHLTRHIRIHSGPKPYY